MLNIPVPSELKDCLARAAGNTPDISSIVMVGAVMQKTAPKELMMDDRRYLKGTFDVCAALGITIAQDVDLNVCNLNDQRDFLQLAREGKIKADMIMYDWLCYAPAFMGQPRLGPQCRQSPLATEYGIWGEAPLKTGARYVMNVHANGVHDLPTALITQYPTYRLEDSRRIVDRTYDLLVR